MAARINLWHVLSVGVVEFIIAVVAAMIDSQWLATNGYWLLPVAVLVLILSAVAQSFVSDGDNAHKEAVGVEIDGASIFVPDAAPDKVGIALDTRVWNSTNEPFYLTSFTLELRLPDGSKIQAPPSAIPDCLSLTGSRSATHAV